MRMDKLVKTAKVALAAATFAIDRPYTYRVPDALAEKLVPGMRVLVPFGAGNRPARGWSSPWPTRCRRGDSKKSAPCWTPGPF